MSEFENRRQKLFDLIPEGSVVIVHSGVSKIASEDEFFPFRVNNNFFYLTGIKQENSILFMVKNLGVKKTYLFIDEYSALKEKWTGKRLSVEEASMISDIKNVLTNNVYESQLDLAIQDGSTHFGTIEKLYIDLSEELKIGPNTSTKEFENRIHELYPHIEVLNIRPLICNLRMVKSNYEIECIKNAINLTHHGINQMLMLMKEGMKEYQLANIFEYYGKDKDKTPLAFDTIVAAGKNATCLHYPSQMDRLKATDLVLFDLGYSVDGYSGDISRTYPISGKFNDLQRQIYSVVLLCNKAVIEYAKPGLTLMDLQNYCVDFFKNELLRTSLLKEEDDIKQVYYHSVSHHLGLDTHDISDRSLPLQPGNVITVEPGLYFAKYGIGIRIEDDILINENGCEILSRSIKKEIDEIEDLLSSIKFKTRG